MAVSDDPPKPGSGDQKLEGHMVELQQTIERLRMEIEELKDSSQTLAGREAKYRALFEQAGDGLLVHDVDGNILEVNRELCALFGYTREEALRLKILDTYPPGKDSLDLYYRIQRRLIDEGQANFTAEFVTKTGARISGEISSRVSLTGDRKLVYTVFRDIADRRRAEEALEESESHYRLLVENMTDLVVKVDREGRFLFVSPSYCVLFGKTQEELLGKTFMPLVHEEDREPTAKAMEGLYRPPHCVCVEQRAMTRDGWRWLAWSDTAVLGDHGEVDAIIGVGRDVTEQREAEEQSRFLSTVAQQATDSIIVTDTAFRITFVNQAVTRLYGYSTEEMMGRTPDFLNAEPDAPRIQQELYDTITSGETYQRESVNRRKDGTTFVCEFKVSPMFDSDGKVVSYVSAQRDITERKRSEAERLQLREQLLQAQKLESVGRLAGGVAHDLNNLLAPILGYSDLLLEGPAGADAAGEPVREIRKAAVRARDLVRQLLAFGRKQTLAFKRLDVNALLRGFQDLLRRAVREDIAIDLALDPGLPSVKGDAGQLEQVVLNLAVNAQDAMPEGGVLAFATEGLELDPDGAEKYDGLPAGPYVQLLVKDTGSGMDEDTRAHLFEPFYTTKGIEAGTGLGLAMVYGIVKQHGGDVVVESEPGRGTTFRILLPAERGLGTWDAHPAR